MWQHMFSMPVMRTVWRRELSSRLHTVRETGTGQQVAQLHDIYDDDNDIFQDLLFQLYF